MNKIRFFIFHLALILAFPGVTSAALITETWESEVTGTSGHTAFNIGDTFTWTVTYDNSNTRHSVYNDGANGIAEFGSGDDFISHTSCVSTDPDPSSCDSIPSGWAFLSEAES